MKSIAGRNAAESMRWRRRAGAITAEHHKHHCKHHSRGSRSPLVGFPRIYSSAIKLRAGTKVGSMGTKLWYHFSSADLPQPFLSPYPVQELS